MASHPYFVTAQQAADALGITRATLYAYTSRGQLRSEPVAGQTRQRRYYRDDVERLRERKEARRDPARAAARGLHWGGPVLESGVTLIHNGRFYYRGHDAVSLAKAATLEEVGGLLWAVEEREREQLFKQPASLASSRLAPLRSSANDPLTMLQAALPLAAATDLAAYDLSARAVRMTGARIVRLFANIVAQKDSQTPAHLALQRRWAPARTAVAEVIRTALVLCADHELNVSAFAARCAASAGATPYDVVSAALATFRGYKHGGAAEQILALLAEIDTAGSARAQVANRLRRGERPPGFGHRLYPMGDPRAARLLQLAEAAGNDSEWRRVRSLMKSASELLNDSPNLDFGLAAVTRVYRLPPHAPSVIFAVGRTIGWIAHAIEEYASGQLIRPRARYTGPAPQDVR